MRSDRTRLAEMLDAAEALVGLLERPDAEEQLRTDRLFRHSVFFEFVALGEQVSAVSAEVQERYPEIPWRRIAAFRHRVAHGYFELSLPIVWQIWSEEVPELRRQLAAILAEEFPGASSAE